MKYAADFQRGDIAALSYGWYYMYNIEDANDPTISPVVGTSIPTDMMLVVNVVDAYERKYAYGIVDRVGVVYVNLSALKAPS